jgi:hypothetical protein
MIDSVLKGTGNSRFLKSAVPAGTSWADALAMLQAGTFPIDFNGINTEGFQQVGTPLNKANLLKDATAAQIGLPPSTTPDGMFRALGNTGELHVWRKTVTTVQEIPAGYTLGDVKTKKAISATGSGQAYIGFYMGYSDSLAVDDNGGISLNPDNDYGEVTANSNFTYISSVIAGKFILIRSYQRPDDNAYSSLAGKIFYVPADASISMTQESNYLYIRLSKCQDVTGYPLTPAGTTTTYPVSTNPNAYQEGSDAKPAGYTLGNAVTGSFCVGYTTQSNGSIYWSAGDISVAEDGTLSLLNAASENVFGSSSNLSWCNANMKGKFAWITSKVYVSRCDFDVGKMVFIPSDAVFSRNAGIYVDKYQEVTGYAAIPAGTTIEYLGKLGDKARVQVLSYVGTGTYGSSNPNSLTFDFVPKLVIVALSKDKSNNPNVRPEPYDGWSNMFLWIHGMAMTGMSQSTIYFTNDGKKLSWYASNYAGSQCNESGSVYTAVAIG